MFKMFKEGIQNIASKLREKEIREEDINKILDTLYLQLISNDVALGIAEEITNYIKKRLLGIKISRFTRLDELFLEKLKDVMKEILYRGYAGNFINNIKTSDKPYSIVFFGVNGVGKTTTIAKLGWHLIKNGLSIVLACSDTFRAAAVEQLEYHANKLGVKLIKHHYGSDPAAVAYDAIKHAQSKGIDVVLIDTAGRQHSNINLMDELRKIVRVISPSYKILVLDALTGNDAYNQAVYFNDGVGVDGIIFTKVDADVKGGAILTVINAINRPILYLGVGQGYDDLIPYDPEFIINTLFSF